MKWVIQTNIWAEEGFEHLLAALDRLGLERCLVKVVPFEGRLEPVEGELPGDGEDAIVMGSYTLAKVARDRGWRPGAFLDNLDYEVQREHWGTRMLNCDSWCGRLRDTAAWYLTSPRFVRPTLDTKSFCGEVMDGYTFSEWRDRIAALDATHQPGDPEQLLTLDTRVMVARPKVLHHETRCWVVDGRVVTASGYKVGTIKRYSPPEAVDARITDFAQQCATAWSPNKGYVIDICETPSLPFANRDDADPQLRIVEAGCLNAAGWYKADLNKLVQALEEWSCR